MDVPLVGQVCSKRFIQTESVNLTTCFEHKLILREKCFLQKTPKVLPSQTFQKHDFFNKKTRPLAGILVFFFKKYLLTQTNKQAASLG